MKKKIIGGFLVVIFLMTIFIANSNATSFMTTSSNELDEIEDYTITVNVKEDGSLDMTYHVEWKVLDSTTEGPLEWVKIGVANANVSKVEKISSNIKKIKYEYNYGNYVRVDFINKYYAGETVSFDFSLNQSHMYTMKSDGTCTYSFTPGWFDDINVKKATVRWNKNNIVKSSSGSREQSGYLVWSKSLRKGEKMNVETIYNQSTFTKLDPDKQSKNADYEKSAGKGWGAFFGVIFFVAIFLICMIPIIGGGSYYNHSGFGYYSHHHYHHFGGRFWRRSWSVAFGGRRIWWTAVAHA